jgi:hypothetical protein
VTPARTDALSETARAEAAEYRQGSDRPLSGYLKTMSVYAGLVGSLSAAVWRTGRLPERVSAGDLALVALATHKTSRLLSKDPVTSPLRAPFTRFRGRSGEAELAEEPRDGDRHVIGELVSCPFCVDQWVATGYVFGLALAPRATRFLAGVFAVRAGADALQFGYDWLQRAATG